jgi:hypothetical protein
LAYGPTIIIITTTTTITIIIMDGWMQGWDGAWCMDDGMGWNGMDGGMGWRMVYG